MGVFMENSGHSDRSNYTSFPEDIFGFEARNHCVTMLPGTVHPFHLQQSQILQSGDIDPINFRKVSDELAVAQHHHHASQQEQHHQPRDASDGGVCRPFMDESGSDDDEVTVDVLSDLDAGFSASQAGERSPCNNDWKNGEWMNTGVKAKAGTKSPGDGEDSRDSSAKKDSNSVRPLYTYMALITMAIVQSPQRKLSFIGICESIMNRFPYYKERSPSWKNTLRHILSINDCFVKIPREPWNPGKGNYWTLDPPPEGPPPSSSLEQEMLRQTGAVKKRKLQQQEIDGIAKILVKQGEKLIGSFNYIIPLCVSVSFNVYRQ
jgi:hypothetical protein